MKKANIMKTKKALSSHECISAYSHAHAAHQKIYVLLHFVPLNFQDSSQLNFNEFGKIYIMQERVESEREERKQ